MRNVCAACGKGFESPKARKTCSERCRKRAQRKPSNLVGLPSQLGRGGSDGLLTAATREGLEKAGRLDTEMGAAAMFLASRLDASGSSEPGGAVASLMREYRATLTDALRDAKQANDPLEEIRGSAALKLIAGG